MRIILLLSFLLIFACTKKEKTFPKPDLANMFTSGDPDVKILVPENLTENLCVDYTPNCLTAFRMRVRLVGMTVLEYESEKTAQKVALEIDQYYFKNWVFDEVRGEPVLERFVDHVFKIKRARDTIKDIKKEEDKENKENKENKEREEKEERESGKH